MNSPLISVVMVTCNVERFLAEAIESILSQTFKDLEFIVLDFGSTDRSKAIASSYVARDRRMLFREMPHCSLPEARNTCCSFARGEYIAIMDADDISVPDRFLWELEFMEKHPEVGLLGGAAEWIDKAGNPLRIERFPTQDREIRAALAIHCPLRQSAAIMRKEVFRHAGRYREVFSQAEDYDLWLRIAERSQCANLEQVVLRYRIHPKQISIRRMTEQALCVLAAQASAAARREGNPDLANSLKEITPAAVATLGINEAAQESKVVDGCRRWIRNMCLAGEYSVALEAAIEVLQEDWEYVETWQIADLYLTAAGLYWGQRRYLRFLLAASHALALRPKVVGRPLRPLLQRLGVA